tara:strand:+ start:340 stop:1086 length:747 start_codon:yes stop_codon:yes gene_type:complete
MAVNINDVYKTVLVITNKDNRGYITPEEFNRLAALAQNEIFESYFNKQAAYEATVEIKTDFSDPVLTNSEKINVFYKNATLSQTGTTFTFPTDFYKLGVVSVDDVVADLVLHEDLKFITLSPLTYPVKTQPVYALVEGGIRLYPSTITSGVTIDYLKKPFSPKWGYAMPTASQIAAGVPNEPIYDSTAFDPATDSYDAIAKSYDFQLHASEENNLIIKILSYAGVIIKQADIAGFAQGKEQQLQATEQ